MNTKPELNYIRFDVKLPNGKVVTITVPILAPEPA